MTSADGQPDTSRSISYTTAGGIAVTRHREPIDAQASIGSLIDQLDTRRGVLLSSNYDYPGRYTRWDLGLCDPLLEVSSRERRLEVNALSERGRLLLAPIGKALEALPELENFRASERGFELLIQKPSRRFAEEERSRQPSVFSAIRALVKLFSSPCDDQLGLYGAFGYDLTFQFEPIRLKHARSASQRDMVLYLPDELLVVDRRKETAFRYRYEFEHAGQRSRSLSNAPLPESASLDVEPIRPGPDHECMSVREVRHGCSDEATLQTRFRHPSPCS